VKQFGGVPPTGPSSEQHSWPPAQHEAPQHVPVVHVVEHGGTSHWPLPQNGRSAGHANPQCAQFIGSL
jgi:hypothetical protein